MALAERLETRFAPVGEDRVAYQTLGEGPIDLVHTIGLGSEVDVMLEDPSTQRYFSRLASFCRVICFDARGSGLSDPRPDDGRTKLSPRDRGMLARVNGRWDVQALAVTSGLDELEALRSLKRLHHMRLIAFVEAKA